MPTIITITIIIISIVLLWSSPAIATIRHLHRAGGGSDKYYLTLSIRNRNITDPLVFYRLMGVDHTADFQVASGDTFTKTFDVYRRGYWLLLVEYKQSYIASAPNRLSRDADPHWIIDVYLTDDGKRIGCSDWRRYRRQLRQK
jgi:hypothetical protein